MSEPISGSAAAGAAGAAAFKALGGPAAVAGGASVLATIVVMVMTLPKNRAEWAVALISTVAASRCGGAAAIQYFGLATWMTTTSVVMALGSIYFVWTYRRSQGFCALCADCSLTELRVAATSPIAA